MPTVSNCYSTGSVSGTSYVGGLVGYNYGAVSNCYSRGTVSGSYDIGGLVGYNVVTVSNSYSTGTVRKISLDSKPFLILHTPNIISYSVVEGVYIYRSNASSNEVGKWTDRKVEAA
jgi:uncharacterized membrane protein YeiH